MGSGIGSKIRDLATLASILASGCLGLPSEPLSTPNPALKLMVRVYQGARADRNILLRAQRYANGVMKRAGVELQWVNCTFSRVDESPRSLCANESNSAWTKITIMPRSMVTRERSPDVFAFTLPSGVVIFSNTIRAFASWYRFNESDVLGAVITHELGHVLLGPGHGSSGLMQADLTPNNFRSFVSGTLRFSPQEVGLMQARLRTTRSTRDEVPGSLHLPELRCRDCGGSAR
jgi:hypothetical protein